MNGWIDLFIVSPYPSVVGRKDDLKSTFAEYMFKDSSFPKEEKAFDPLSRYIEEKADAKMPSVIFDELFLLYEERFL